VIRLRQIVSLQADWQSAVLASTAEQRRLPERSGIQPSFTGASRLESAQRLRIVGNHCEMGARRLIGRGRDVISQCEFFLRKPQRPPRRFRSRHPSRDTALLRCRGTHVRIGHGGGFDLFVGHRPQPRPVCLVFERLGRAIGQDLDEGPVTLPFGYDRILFFCSWIVALLAEIIRVRPPRSVYTTLRITPLTFPVMR